MLQQELFMPQWSTTGPVSHFLQFSRGPSPVSHQSLMISTNATQEHAIPYQESPESPDYLKVADILNGAGAKYRTFYNSKGRQVKSLEAFLRWAIAWK